MDGFAALLVALVPTQVSSQEAGGTVAGSSRTQQEEFLERLAEFMRSAPRPEVLRGDLSITGRVVTDAGEPLGGVLIRAMLQEEPRAYPWRPAFDDAPPPDPALADSVRRSVDYWVAQNRGRRETTTAADGSFAMTDLVEGLFELQGWHAGFSVLPEGVSSQNRIWVSAGAAVAFIATPSMIQPIAIRLPDGTVPDRVNLQLHRYGDSNGDAWQTWAPAESTVRLPAGDWYVTAAVGSANPLDRSVQNAWFASEATLVAITPPQAPELVTLELRGVPAIEGTINLPVGERRPYLRVHAVPLAPGQEPEQLLLEPARQKRESRGRDASVDRNSSRGATFRIGPIEPGRWFVTVTGEARTTTLASAVIELGDTVVTHDFTLPPSDPREELDVRVFDPDGALLRNCVFEQTTFNTSPDGRVFHSGYVQIGSRRRTDGSFSVSAGGRSDRSVLFARHPRFGVQVIEYQSAAQLVNVHFLAPVVARLRLADYAENVGGRSVEIELDRLVEARRTPKTERFDRRVIARDGTVELGMLQPGTYRVRLFADADPDDSYSGFEVAAATFALSAGPCVLTLPFPKLSVVRLAVAAGAKGSFTLAPITWTSDDSDRGRRRAEPDPDGMITFAEVPPGSYRVEGPGNETMQVEAPARDVVAFVAEAVNAQRVVVTDPEGRLARAGLKTGDWIVAIDGREFDNREELYRIRQSLLSDEITLTAERAGARFEIVLPRRCLQDGRAAGGYFIDSSR